MEKIGPICMIGMIVLSGLGAGAFSPTVSPQPTLNCTTEPTVVQFSPLQLSEKDGFLKIQLTEATTQLIEPNRPLLPIYVKTYEIPYGSSNIQVVCQELEINTLTLTKEVIPVCLTADSKRTEQTTYEKDPTVYQSSAFYPDTWYSVELGAGRNEQNQQVTFVKIVCDPVRYSPVNNQIEYTTGFDISVTYTPPNAPRNAPTESYTMVIIAPKKFAAALQPLIDFKNNHGVPTVFKSVEDIYKEYTGYDKPEQIKYFIKYAYDTWNVSYVFLVGGLKNHLYAKDRDTRSAGYKAWWVPVRYVNMPNDDEKSCLSDLYYGCLYNATGSFDSWDSNHDGVYAAWNAPNAQKDTFDLYPEVYVSRAPVSSVIETKRIVKRIIAYESTGPSDKPWYTTFIGIAGLTFYYWDGQPDAEYLCDLAYNNTKLAIPNLQQIKIYSTNRDTGGLVPTPEDISSTISKGASFVDFEGHGYALGWNTIWFDGTYPINWTGGIGLNDFWRIQNGNKAPVVVVGGCHNGLYNVSTLAGMFGKGYFTSGLPSPVCFSWGLVIKPLGGAIASTGCTGYGVGSSSGDPAGILSAALETNFFYEIGHGATHLAQTHSQAIVKYLNEHTIKQTDAYCITNWALFGDPSLYYGGYS